MTEEVIIRAWNRPPPGQPGELPPEAEQEVIIPSFQIQPQAAAVPQAAPAPTGPKPTPQPVPTPSDDYWQILKEAPFKAWASLGDVMQQGSTYGAEAFGYKPPPTLTETLKQTGIIGAAEPKTVPGRLLDIGTQVLATGGVNPLTLARGGAKALGGEVARATGATVGIERGEALARAHPDHPVLGAAATFLGAAFGGHVPNIVSNRARNVALFFTKPENAGLARIADALLNKNPGMTIQEATEQARAFIRGGGDQAAMLADYQPGQGLAKAIASLGGTGEDIAVVSLENRALESADRALTKLKGALSTAGQAGEEAAERVIAEQRSPTTSPLRSLEAPDRLRRTQALVPEPPPQPGFPQPLASVTPAERKAAIAEMVKRERMYAETFRKVLKGKADVDTLREAMSAAAGGRTGLVRYGMNKLAQLRAFMKLPNASQREALATHLFASGDDALAALDAIDQGIASGVITAHQAKRLRSMLARYSPQAAIILQAEQDQAQEQP